MLYASGAGGEGGSMLAWKTFESWAGSANWTFAMPEGEAVCAIAASASFAAAATSAGQLRIFSPAGNEDRLVTSMVLHCLVTPMMMPSVNCSKNACGCQVSKAVAIPCRPADLGEPARGSGGGIGSAGRTPGCRLALRPRPHSWHFPLPTSPAGMQCRVLRHIPNALE